MVLGTVASHEFALLGTVLGELECHTLQYISAVDMLKFLGITSSFLNKVCECDWATVLNE